MNEFDQWNVQKKNIDADNSALNRFPKEGEVWITYVGKNIGFEQNGSGEDFSRPVLIIKRFNNHMFWVVPLSTKQKAFDFYYNFTDPNNEAVSAILAQLKLVSIKRLQRKLYYLPEKNMKEIRARLKKFLS